VFQSGGEREQNLSVREYAAVHQRSRIVLNFAKTGWEGGIQVKGRVFEATLCGALLLEEANVQIKKWFEPGKDYVPFLALDDLVEKVHYYPGHEDERARIARNGWKKATRLYNARRFWGRVLELANLAGPAWSPRRLWEKVRSQPLRRLPARVWRKVWGKVQGA